MSMISSSEMLENVRESTTAKFPAPNFLYEGKSGKVVCDFRRLSKLDYCTKENIWKIYLCCVVREIPSCGGSSFSDLLRSGFLDEATLREMKKLNPEMFPDEGSSSGESSKSLEERVQLISEELTTLEVEELPAFKKSNPSTRNLQKYVRKVQKIVKKILLQKVEEDKHFILQNYQYNAHLDAIEKEIVELCNDEVGKRLQALSDLDDDEVAPELTEMLTLICQVNSADCSGEKLLQIAAKAFELGHDSLAIGALNFIQFNDLSIDKFSEGIESVARTLSEKSYQDNVALMSDVIPYAKVPRIIDEIVLSIAHNYSKKGMCSSAQKLISNSYPSSDRKSMDRMLDILGNYGLKLLEDGNISVGHEYIQFMKYDTEKDKAKKLVVKRYLETEEYDNALDWISKIFSSYDRDRLRKECAQTLNKQGKHDIANLFLSQLEH